MTKACPKSDDATKFYGRPNYSHMKQFELELIIKPNTNVGISKSYYLWYCKGCEKSNNEILWLWRRYNIYLLPFLALLYEE